MRALLGPRCTCTCEARYTLLVTVLFKAAFLTPGPCLFLTKYIKFPAKTAPPWVVMLPRVARTYVGLFGLCSYTPVFLLLWFLPCFVASFVQPKPQGHSLSSCTRLQDAAWPFAQEKCSSRLFFSKVLSKDRKEPTPTPGTAV